MARAAAIAVVPVDYAKLVVIGETMAAAVGYKYESYVYMYKLTRGAAVKGAASAACALAPGSVLHALTLREVVLLRRLCSLRSALVASRCTGGPGLAPAPGIRQQGGGWVKE